jgi:hypothetical protein
MKKLSMFVWLALALCTPLAAQAQFTSVSGTITDPNGLPYTNASVQATLVPPPGGPTLTLSGAQFAANVPPGRTDAKGNFSLLLADNTQIQCNLGTCTPQTQWSFLVDVAGIAAPLGSGQQTFTVVLTISGASQDISAQLSAAAPSLLKPIVSSSSCTLVAGTCQHLFPPPGYTVAPKCTANGSTVANAMAVNATTSAVTVTSAVGADTQVVNILCAPPIN